MSLAQEINQMRSEIRTDGYPISIGELISMYRADELDIHPEFQRFYRWTDEQKSRLVESILLNIPIPSIFVSQREDAVWDVVDGLQRLSTIFQLIGELKDDKGERLPALTLQGTKYLPSLEGKTWDPTASSEGIGATHQLIVRRSKIDVKIILRESNPLAKYELFQRLNTGGSHLSDQEIRNVILMMVNPQAYEWIEELAQDEHFRECTPLSDLKISHRDDLEMVTRFVVFRRLPEFGLRDVRDLRKMLDDNISDFALSQAFDTDKNVEAEAFRFTFAHLAQTMGEDSFRRYDYERRRHVGPCLISAFEAIAMGLGHNFEHYKELPANEFPDVGKIVRALWINPDFLRRSGSGVGLSSRIRDNIPLGRQLFAPGSTHG